MQKGIYCTNQVWSRGRDTIHLSVWSPSWCIASTGMESRLGGYTVPISVKHNCDKGYHILINMVSRKGKGYNASVSMETRLPAPSLTGKRSTHPCSPFWKWPPFLWQNTDFSAKNDLFLQLFRFVMSCNNFHVKLEPNPWWMVHFVILKNPSIFCKGQFPS